MRGSVFGCTDRSLEQYDATQCICGGDRRRRAFHNVQQMNTGSVRRASRAIGVLAEFSKLRAVAAQLRSSEETLIVKSYRKQAIISHLTSLLWVTSVGVPCAFYDIQFVLGS